MADIQLNFLSINEGKFSFPIFKKLPIEGESEDSSLYIYSLPSTPDNEEWHKYLVSFEPREGFEHYEADFLVNRHLTKKYLLVNLLKQLEIKSEYPFEHISAFAGDRIEFTFSTHLLGRRVIFLMPYFLEKLGLYGFLIDFKFAKSDNALFSKDVQKLSLSLDGAGNSNKNYYTDKYRLIQSFLSKAYADFRQFPLGNGTFVSLNQNLCKISAFQLNKKEYLFHNHSSSYSQFQGIRNFGPYQAVSEEIIYVFIFEDKYRSFANDLYLSLIGKLNPGTFPGLSSMFKLNLNLYNVRKIPLKDYSKETLSSAVEQLKTIKLTGKKLIGIYVEDYSSEDDDASASKAYYFLKYQFIKEDIPLQVVNYRKLSSKNALKWSTSNLALQIFSKLGGIPWIVKPSNTNCLILGVGSSHKKDKETGEIIKYFAYTVCLDSSGLYKSLEILADANAEDTYLEQLQKNIINLLQSGRFSNYNTCVLHLPFKIKDKEVEALTKAIEQIKKMLFVAVKINLDNKFFGYSSHNTLVPYESSCIQLSKREYLIWFEGLQYGKEIVDKRLSNPVHIQFLNLIEGAGFNERDYLQDILNLSGANWRGFNSRSVPISIYYSKIITDYTKAFEELEEYEENAVSNEKPWFL